MHLSIPLAEHPFNTLVIPNIYSNKHMGDTKFIPKRARGKSSLISLDFLLFILSDIIIHFIPTNCVTYSILC